MFFYTSAASHLSVFTILLAGLPLYSHSQLSIGTVFVFKEPGADYVVKDFVFFKEPAFLPLCFKNALIRF